MFIIFIIVLIVLLFIPYTRIILFNPFKSIYYLCLDSINFFRFKTYKKPKSGKMICYSGHFGKGKTLSMVYDVTKHFKRYNGRKWYDMRQKQWRTNNVVILSNVVLSVPYVPLENASQITNYMQELKTVDSSVFYEVYICIDEASVVFNSRNFKDNINPLLLNSLLTCRHYNASFYYTSQKFKLVDALLRSVTQEVRACGKLWRCALYKKYDADVVENAIDLKECKSIGIKTYFCSNAVFNFYDTLATVDNLQKKYSLDDMLSSEAILNSISSDVVSVSVKQPKKRLFGR